MYGTRIITDLRMKVDLDRDFRIKAILVKEVILLIVLLEFVGVEWIG